MKWYPLRGVLGMSNSVLVPLSQRITKSCDVSRGSSHSQPSRQDRGAGETGNFIYILFFYFLQQPEKIVAYKVVKEENLFLKKTLYYFVYATTFSNCHFLLFFNVCAKPSLNLIIFDFLVLIYLSFVHCRDFRFCLLCAVYLFHLNLFSLILPQESAPFLPCPKLGFRMDRTQNAAAVVFVQLQIIRLRAQINSNGLRQCQVSQHPEEDYRQDQYQLLPVSA